MRAWHAVRWYVHELMGDSAYDHYVARHHVDHPDHEPLTAAQWWRAKADAEASAPQTRCC
ncbi:MAG: YbdD/YjiX family protein [Cellulomonadaceae bacterium]